MLKDFKPRVSVNALPSDLDISVGAADRIAKVAREIGGEAQQGELRTEEVQEAVSHSAGKRGEFRMVPLDMLSYSPKTWNQFTPLSDDMKVQMAKSILLTGLQQPIVIREVSPEPSGYQILAGNTRTEIYRVLRNAVDQERYATIPAIVYKYGEIDDEMAKLIVTDTNYIQRAQLSKKDRAFAIHEKLSYLRSHGDVKALDKVAEELHISLPTAYFWDMVHNLIPELFDMYDDGRLELRAAARLGVFPVEIQQQLLEEQEFLTNEVILQIPARTKPEKVLDKFHEIVEKETNPLPENGPSGEWHVKRTARSIHVSVKGKRDDGYEPYVVLLPPDQIKRFLKKYEQFVLTEDAGEETVQNDEE